MPDLWGGFPDYYGTLRVAPDASEDELRSAWRAAAKRWHPDTNRGQDAAAMMRRVNEAWSVLGDRDARALYDEVYFAWRSGSEQLAGDLNGLLNMQRERRQARAASAEWGRWGREDRGRWGREQRREAGAQERDARGGGNGAGSRSERRRSRDEGSGSRDSAGSDAPQGELDANRWAIGALVVVVIGIVVVIVGAIASSS